MSMEPRFIDRISELNELMKFAERGFYPVLYLYGPEGCGKTRLLKELYNRIRGHEEFVVVYVDAQSTESVERAIYAPSEVLQLVVDAAKDLAGAPGRVVALALLQAMKKLRKIFLHNKHVVVLVDDVAKPLGFDTLEMYAKNMLNLVEELLSTGARSVLALATTSEGISRNLLARHNYISITQIWNLDRGSFSELLNELGAPDHVGEEAWFALGGNPRLALALKAREWKLVKLEEDFYRSVRASLEVVARRFRKELQAVVEDIDIVLDYPELRIHLLEANLITPIDRPCIGYTPPVDYDLGIGRYYAWQVPLYRELVRRYLKEHGP